MYGYFLLKIEDGWVKMMTDNFEGLGEIPGDFGIFIPPR